MGILLKQLRTTQCVTNSCLGHRQNPWIYTSLPGLSSCIVTQQNVALPFTDTNSLRHGSSFKYSFSNREDFKASTFHYISDSISCKFLVKSTSLNLVVKAYKFHSPLCFQLRSYSSSTNQTVTPGSMASNDQQTSSQNIDKTLQDGSGTVVPTGSLPAHEVSAMNEAKEIFSEAVTSVLPKEMIAKALVVDTQKNSLTVEGVTYHLDHNVYVVGFGKAVLGMARAVDDLIGQHIVRGVVSVPHGIQEEFKKAGKTEMVLNTGSLIEVREGAANNMPDQPAHMAAMEIADLVKSVKEGDLLLVLISGGGSALLPAPTSPITLSDMLSVTGQMSRGGATITQLNTVRKQLDFLKGGGIATLAHPAQVISLILSDIVGDPLDLIASGPTVTDTSKPEDCLTLFSHLNILDTVPASVTQFLREKSLKTREESNVSQPECVEMTHVLNAIIGSNRIACERACEWSIRLGYLPFVLSTQLEGEAKEVGKMFSHIAFFIAAHLAGVSVDLKKIEDRLTSTYKLTDMQMKEMLDHVENARGNKKGVCIIAGGETTVTVTGTGRGGRNQEMAVSAGLEFGTLFKDVLPGSYNDSSHSVEDNDNCPAKPNPPISLMNVVFLSAGTDGQDGPTPVAGGVVGLNFAQNAEGLNPEEYLDNNDSYSLLKTVSDGFGLVHTGLTGTNVMDIQLLLINGAK